MDLRFPGQQLFESDLSAGLLDDLDGGTSTADVVPPDHLRDEAFRKTYYIREGTLREAVYAAVAADRVVVGIRHQVWTFLYSLPAVKQRLKFLHGKAE